MGGSDTTIDRRTALKAGSALAAAFTAGCTGQISPPLDQVSIHVVDVQRPKTGVSSLTLPLVLEFENDADTSVPDVSIATEVLVQGVAVATAQKVVGTLEPGESVRKQLDVIVDYANTGDAIVRAIERGNFSVRLQGELEANTLLGSTTVQFEKQVTT